MPDQSGGQSTMVLGSVGDSTINIVTRPKIVRDKVDK
jgi:hypothetical protein